MKTFKIKHCMLCGSIIFFLGVELTPLCKDCFKEQHFHLSENNYPDYILPPVVKNISLTATVSDLIDYSQS